MEEKLKYCGSERTYVMSSIPVATIKFFFKSGNNVLFELWILRSQGDVLIEIV